jgi:hypothetical protein
MTFQYSVTLPIKGSDKLRRFREWADTHLPQLSYSLQPQSPVKTEAMTVRLLTMEDRARVLHTMATSPLS